MNFKILFSLAVCALLSGCAWKSQAVKVAAERYQTSANASLARGAKTGARELALDEANKTCASLGKEISDVDIQSHWTFPANGAVVVTFACAPLPQQQAHPSSGQTAAR